MVLKHQGYNKHSYLEYINNTALMSAYDNYDNNTQVNNNSRIVKQDIDTFSMNQDHLRNTNSSSKNNNIALMIFHQNIGGLHKKTDELLNFWTTELPHIFCLTEHHLSDHEISSTCIKNYNLRAKYCRKSHKHGGESIFVHETLLLSTIELTEYCNDNDLEICAAKLHISSSKFCILCLYRPPTGNFAYFLSSLESILNQLHINSINIIICGDTNIILITPITNFNWIPS
jgi:hypothetical protein